MLNRLELLKARILRTLYPTPSDFLNAYKFGLEVNKELVKKWRLVHYLSQGYKLLVLALTIKAKGEGSALELVTLGSLLVPFKKVKGLNAKMLRTLFLFKGKVPKANGEDSKSDKSTSLEDVFIASSLQKHKAGKASNKSPRKKLKIGPAEPSGKANRQKEKVAIIAKANRKVIIRKPRPKQKIKCLYHSKTPVELIKALNSKKELKGGVPSILQQFIIA